MLIPTFSRPWRAYQFSILAEITKTGSISVKNLLYCREIIQMSSLMSVKWGLFMTSAFAWARNLELVACGILRPCHLLPNMACENSVKVVQMSSKLQCSPKANREWEKQRCFYYYKVRFSLRIRDLVKLNVKYLIVDEASFLPGHPWRTFD